MDQTNSNNNAKLKNTIYICGLIFEIASVFGLLWAILLCFLLLKFGNTKIIVSYVPLLSLCLATLGHLFLLVFHLIPQLIGFDVGETYDAAGDFLFFPFWYGQMLSLCLLAINRVAICMNISLNHFVFNTKWMLTFVGFGWLWGCAIGIAALSTSSLSFLNNDLILKIINQDNEPIDQNNTEKEHLLSSTTVGYVLIVTHVLDSLTVISLLLCYTVVIYHVTKGRQILRAQNSILLMSIANTIGVVLPEAPAANRMNRIFPISMKAGIPGNKVPPSVVPPGRNSYNFQQPTYQHGFWSITFHFCLMSSSAACFGLFVFVSNFFRTPQIILAQYGIYLISALTNTYLLSTVNTKIKELLFKTFKCLKCWCTSISPAERLA